MKWNTKLEQILIYIDKVPEATAEPFEGVRKKILWRQIKGLVPNSKYFVIENAMLMY